jgi:hypothetical protein
MEGISLAYFNCSSDSFGLFNNFAIEHENIFNFSPNKTYKSAQAKAAEPAPETTNFTSSAFFIC